MRNPSAHKERGIQKRGKLNKKDVRYILRRLWVYIEKYKLTFFLAFLIMLASNVLSLLGPRLTGLAIDEIGTQAGKVNFEPVLRYAIIIAVFYLASGVLSYLLSVVMVHLSQKITKKMRNDVFKKLSSLPVGFFDTHQTGDIISVISYDINTVNETLSHDLLNVAKSSVIIIVSLVMMIQIAPILMLVFLITIPITIIFARIVTKIIRPYYRKRSAKLGELNGFVEEMTAGFHTIRAYGREDETIEKFDEKNDEAVNAYTRAECLGTITGPSVNFINNFSLTLVSVFSAIMFIYGRISLGDISSFVLYSRKFTGPINAIANVYSDIQSAIAAAERVFRLLDEEPEKKDSKTARALTDIKGEVELKNVTFGYNPQKTVIHDLSLKADKGSVIAVVGPTGAGKSTIINLLMRFYDIESGKITIDNESIYDLTRDSVRRSYTMVLQDTWLFHGTIFENIAYGKEDATMQEVVKAAKAAKIHRFIESLPEGYNTILTDDGTNISKGQKQLLTIARAMLMNSRMLILDEATSNVDSQTEQKIQDAMYKLMRGKTCFVIAHRLSTIKNADLILVVRDGEIVEKGKHKELLKAGGFYSELYNSQFEADV